MKTLIISFDKDFPIKTAGNLVVYSYDLVKDLIYEVSNEIAGSLESSFLGDKNTILLEFEKDRPSQYNDFIKLLKSKLLNVLSETNIPETLSFPFPDGYVEWLRYNTKPQFVEIGKTILEKNPLLQIKPREIYADYIQGTIIPAIDKLIGEFSDIHTYTITDINDDNFQLSKEIKDLYPSLHFIPFYNGKIQREIGLAYYNGIGTVQNLKNAFYYFERGAEDRDPDALCYVGMFYETGQIIEQDFTKAFNYYRESQRAGSLIGSAYLGHAYQKGIGIKNWYNLAIKYYQPAAEAEILMAQENLGDIYYEGQNGFVRYDKAYKIYSSIKNKPSSRTSYRLGKILYEGLAGSKNELEALKYLKVAACENIEDACFLCGKILENKETEIKDEIEPYQYYKQGAEAGEYKASTEYAIYLKSKNDTSEIETLLSLGVEKGYAKAQYELALYLTETLTENFSETKEQTRDDLLSLAVAQQYQPAILLSENIKQEKARLRISKIDENKEKKERFQRLTKEFILMVQTNYAIEKLNVNLYELHVIVNLLLEPSKAGYPYAMAYMGLVQLLIDPSNKDAFRLVESSTTMEDKSNIYIDFLGNKDLRKENEDIIKENFGGINLYFKNLWGLDIDINQQCNPLYDSYFCFDECNIILGYCYLIGFGVEKSVLKAIKCFERCKRLEEFLKENQYEDNNEVKEIVNSYKIINILSNKICSQKSAFPEIEHRRIIPMKKNAYVVKKQGNDFIKGLRLINTLINELEDLKNVGLFKEESIEQLYYTKMQNWQPVIITLPPMFKPYHKVYKNENEFQYVEIINPFYQIKTKFNGPSYFVNEIKCLLNKGDIIIKLTKGNFEKNITNIVLTEEKILIEETINSKISFENMCKYRLSFDMDLDVSEYKVKNNNNLMITISVKEKLKEENIKAIDESKLIGNNKNKEENSGGKNDEQKKQHIEDIIKEKKFLYLAYKIELFFSRIFGNKK